jgi:hypothetical protein
VSLAITTVPPAVRCIQITVTGSSTVTRNFAATPGAGTVASLSLGNLPLGSVTITGQAFNTTCARIGSQQPTWVADKQVVSLEAGVVTSLTITFRPDNPVTGTPTFVGNVVQVAVGAALIGVVMSDGTVEAAGTTIGGTQATFGAFVPALSNVAQLAPSTETDWQCALLEDQSVECWGVNDNGQLGNGTTTPASTPVPVTGLTNVTQLSAGGFHACAMQPGASGINTPVCWGFNGRGSLGDGSTTDATTPVPVSGSFFRPTSIVCGGAHTCLIDNGRPWCWGFNAFGQVGNNSTMDVSVPTEIFQLNAITQLALGGDHTCALRDDGSVFCWGNGADGQLGGGTLASSLVPVQVPISNVVQIGAGADFTCARRSDGTVWCWGNNSDGSVGDGTGSGAVLSPVQVGGLPPSVGLSLAELTACSSGADLSIECWGFNGGFQLGGGVNEPSAFSPVPITL